MVTNDDPNNLKSIRTHCQAIFDATLRGESTLYRLELGNLDRVVDHVAHLIDRDYGGQVHLIPPHGRWRHYPKDLLEKELLEGKEPFEQTRILIDLFSVSVLLDAGAGAQWKYKAKAGQIYTRSEGLAIATLEAMQAGLFGPKGTVTGAGLTALSLEDFADAFQVTRDNPLVGVEGRFGLLKRLGNVLATDMYFRPAQRPGCLVDYLTDNKSHISLWRIIMETFGQVWPERPKNLNIRYNVDRADVWPCPLAPGGWVPFHKLSQWLAYSLMEPMQKILGWQFPCAADMTGLPEYRNGGLFLAHQVIQPLFQAGGCYPVGSQEVIQWRALTVILLDRVKEALVMRLKAPLSLPMVLEAGTWKAGREISQTHPMPFTVEIDGVTF